MNETIQTILTRKSIRSYKAEQISDSDLDLILQAAVRAPTGGNSQSWHFTVLQNKSKLLELNALVRETYQKLIVAEDTYQSIKAGKIASGSEKYSFYFHAPTLIIVSNKRDFPNAMADSAVAIENMLLTAHSLGLGSCWVNTLTWFGDHADIRRALSGFGIPADYKVCGTIALGYCASGSGKLVPRKTPMIHFVR